MIVHLGVFVQCRQQDGHEQGAQHGASAQISINTRCFLGPVRQGLQGRLKEEPVSVKRPGKGIFCFCTKQVRSDI
jgi:hypothetical protein